MSNDYWLFLRAVPSGRSRSEKLENCRIEFVQDPRLFPRRLGEGGIS